MIHFTHTLQFAFKVKTVKQMLLMKSKGNTGYSMLLHIFISHKCRLQVHTVNKPTRFIIRLFFGFASDLYLSDSLFVKLNKNINK